MSRERQVQRGHHYAIVDEVDSILIDEARTPLIISGRVADAAQLYYKFASIVRGLRRDEDYEVDEEKRTVSPTEDGIEKVEQALGIDNLYDGVAQNLVHQLQAALRGQGAVQAGQGLHRRQRRGEDRRRVHRPHPRGPALVRGPPPGGRGQGGREDQGGEPDPRHGHPPELLPHVREARRDDRYRPHRGGRVRQHLRPPRRARPHQPGQRPRSTRATSSTSARTASSTPCVDDIAERYAAGQPVLVGTISVEKSEKLSRLLDKRGIAHEVLNAKQHTREAEIVAQAGRLQAVTVATNMAGRGVDILLGGNPEGLALPRPARRGPRPDVARGRGPATTCCSRSTWRETQAEGDKIRELGRPLRARHRAPRVPPHRQPAAWPVGPPGRPGREPLLPVARGRPHAPVRHRRHQLGDGQGPARRHAPRGEDGLQGHRAGADHRRAEERRDPQERPQVRRGHERAAQGDLRAARPDPRQAPTCASASSPSTCPRPSRPSSTPTAWPTSTRSGTSRACTPRCSRSGPATLTVEDLAEATTTKELYELLARRRRGALRGRARRSSAPT